MILGLYQGTTSVVPSKPRRSLGFSPRCLSLYQIREAIRILLRPLCQPGFHRICRYVFPVTQETLLVYDAHFREASLPYFPQVAVFLPQPIGESTFDELHRSFDRHLPPYSEQQVEMVRHDHKVVDSEPSGRHIGTEDVNQKQGVALRLQQRAPAASLCGGEERTRRVGDSLGIGVASGFGHVRRALKPRLLLRLFGTTGSRALIQESAGYPGKFSSAERGVTLVELMIAITLVAAIVAGLLFAMRTSLLAYQKLNGRLEDDTRAMRIEQALERQISGLVPLVRDCPGIKGDEQSLRFVSAYSLAEGSRGYLRVVEYVVAPDLSGGGVRLMMNERLYSGRCSPDPPLIDGESMEAAGKLKYCRIGYREFFADNMMAGNWVARWDRPTLPGAVRIEMAPIDVSVTRLPMLTLNVPVRITRDLGTVYVDEPR